MDDALRQRVLVENFREYLNRTSRDWHVCFALLSLSVGQQQRVCTNLLWFGLAIETHIGLHRATATGLHRVIGTIQILKLCPQDAPLGKPRSTERGDIDRALASSRKITIGKLDVGSSMRPLTSI